MASASSTVKAQPCEVHEYALKGQQVEYQASYWMYCSKLHIVSLQELTTLTDDENNKDGYFPPWCDPTEGEARVRREMDELVELASHRDDPCALVGDAQKQGKLGLRKPISRLLNLTPPAIGATLLNRFPGEQIIRTGRGMARAVEAETPGLFHRHALNYLIGLRHWSPPRQALVWAALDVALASALQAAWYYKWLSPRPFTSRRERPIEYSDRNQSGLTVLFDRPDELNPAYNLCPDARTDDPAHPNHSGTPRHPAYPSGHSTYSGAASALLEHFFGAQPIPEGLVPEPAPGHKPTLGTELDHLADNIGLGRMWAGIHWRSDHENGVKLGRVVAGLVVQQLADMGINLCLTEPTVPKNQCDFTQTQQPCASTAAPKSRQEIETEALQFQAQCGTPKAKPAPCAAPAHRSLDANRGVQRGAS